MNKAQIENTNDYELIMLFREDDEDAKNILYYKYRFIIDIIIRKNRRYFNMLNIDYQEVYSECTVGFSDALRCFREEKNATLPTFITLCIERRINNLLKKYSREKRKYIKNSYSLDYIYEQNDSSLIDMISDNCLNDPLISITEEENYNELLENIKNILTINEYNVFVLKIKGLNYLEIAKILNKEPKQIDNAIQRIKNKIRNMINKKENSNSI